MAVPIAYWSALLPEQDALAGEGATSPKAELGGRHRILCVAASLLLLAALGFAHAPLTQLPRGPLGAQFELRPVSWGELTTLMRSISRSLGGPDGDLNEQLSASARGLGPLPKPLLTMRLNSQPSEEPNLTVDVQMLLVQCGVTVESAVNSLAIVGLAADGAKWTCDRRSPSFDQSDCSANAIAAVSFLAYTASYVLDLPGLCALATNITEVNCAAGNALMAASTLNVAADVFVVRSACWGQQEEASNDTFARRLAGSGGRRLRGPTSFYHYLDKLRGRETEGGSDGEEAAEKNSTEGNSTEEEYEEDRRRAVDVTVCYFTAENTAATLVGTVADLWTTLKECGRYQRLALEADQRACAAEVANVVNDFSSLISNAAVLASSCPIEKQPKAAPCIAGWADIVTALSNWAVWAASFEQDCLLNI